MCGIAGIVRTHAPGAGPVRAPLESIPESWLDTLEEAIAHRGPDGLGRFRDRAVGEDGTTVDVALVHRRLSIIDHAGGHQPMVHDGQRLRLDLVYRAGDTPVVASEFAPEVPLIALVFNGCIYNHRELRAEIESLGHRFDSDHADTEVLLHAWREWGAGDGRECELQKRLNSMHAALVWDRSRARVASLRDPFGEKPLYKRHDQDESDQCRIEAWSSVPHPLVRFATGCLRSRTGPEKLWAWIRHGWDASWPGGHLEINESRCASDDASEPDDRPIPDGFGVARWIENAGKGPHCLDVATTERLIRDAVRKRLDADVPLGCFLSGGIDSSLITRFACDELGSASAFTVRMPDRAYDESEYAHLAADAIGADLCVLDCRADPASDLVSLIERSGLPFGDSSLLPTYWVCRAASEQVKVALTGDGGDELFCGYERHTIALMANRLGIIAKMTPLALLPDRDPRSKLSKARRLLGASRLSRASLGPELAAIFSRNDLRRLLGPAAVSASDGMDANSGRSIGSTDVRLWDIDRYLRSDLVRKTDTASMHVPIEVRSPLLDPVLAEAAIRTPSDVLMPGGERKGLLKQVARRHLPPEIVDRPKQGFAIPIGSWFRSDYGAMRQLLHDRLRSADPFPGFADMGLELDRRFILRMLEEHDAAGERSLNPWRGRDHSQRLYVLLVMSIWAGWLGRTEVPPAGGQAARVTNRDPSGSAQSQR